MTEEERRALEALRFNWAWTPDDVWGETGYHVEGMHAEVDREVLAGLRDAAASRGASPIGLVLRGQRGAGKTHLLGWVRRQVRERDGYFFLVDLDQADELWTGVLLSVRRDLMRADATGHTQLAVLLRRLAAMADLSEEHAAAIAGEAPVSRKDLDRFVTALRRVDPQVVLETRETLRALVLYGAGDDELSTIGGDYLGSLEESTPGERAAWGVRPGARPPRLVVRDVSWLSALTGPAVIAVDQLDAVAAGVDGGRRALNRVALGLMALRENTRRTLSVVACITPTWTQLRKSVFSTATDRFREVAVLRQIEDAELARELVARRLAAPYAEVGFVPPHPTWPVAVTAFDGIEKQFTPRALLQRVDAHVRQCLLGGRVSELERLDTEPEPDTVEPACHDLEPLDSRFAELKGYADIGAVLAPGHEDGTVPALLTAGLTAWMVEQGDSGVEWRLDPPFGSSPALHARLRRTLEEETETEAHWSFRAIGHGNARAAQTRLRDARAEAGLRPDGTRHLVVLRNSGWPNGRVTAEHVASFRESGGVDLPVADDDLRTFRALETLLAERPPGLEAWLVSRKPASGTELLDTVLGRRTAEPSTPDPIPESTLSASITVGVTVADGTPVRVPVESLRRHAVVFAGTGSGKTVLLRRLVEECALRGVSSIVLDPNNDLARLGDPWPAPPPGWAPSDATLAQEYLANTEVVVWTPGRRAGRPLSFQPLPDFAAVAGDADELAMAVEAAAASLEPRANVTGANNKARWSRAVLREALTYYARQGRRTLDGLIAVLADLPEGASTIDGAQKLAVELATSLRAAKVNDTLFGGAGEPVDPGALLTPSRGRRARVSVISFVGLRTEEQRQSFVNQLQLELFSWVKEHPAGDRPLGGLLVMDEAQTLAPAVGTTPSTQSTLMLVAQARKYGLGLVFATQAPKALHNRVPGNASTVFVGRLNAPVQIAAARELAQSKGGRLDHVGALKVAQFYASTEGSRFQRLRTPNCLTHHPASALTPEEVVHRARAAQWPDHDPDD
ncbi:helicase HerA domain-containing protein [Actinophytocola xanthii]|uniref:AAA+ ATPase domain-containing protein n=1 Tax=Actinophytocola xanthii TaxID=1912961 RepID=A0A1Q8C1L3_9PSEU|nr:DUF87 domain-containing protein [Actinophytocola xanthii]OLF08248.1 hypothetical protein BU204_34540 [Actinophytocola xanthii]